MATFVIERNIPDASKLTPDQHQEIASTSGVRGACQQADRGRWPQLQASVVAALATHGASSAPVVDWARRSGRGTSIGGRSTGCRWQNA